MSLSIRNRRRPALVFFVLIALSAIGAPPQAAPKGPAGAKVTVTIDAAKAGPPISPYFYGQFLENLGTTVNGSLWAEMIDDRKFFYPVSSSDKLEPPNSRRWNRWRSVGPDAAVGMDRKDPFVGEHSPVIRLDPASPHGIAQAGLFLVKGRAYTGRVVLAGDPGVTVEASLIWGDGEAGRQTVRIAGLGFGFAKFPLSFTAGADAPSGRLEITARGTGSFRIGAVSLMRADNVHGMRPDTLAQLGEIGFTFSRWPGGNFVSGYDWKDGIGDPDRRPQVYDYAWDAVEPNDFGLDEFLTFCRILDIRPYIAVNSGFGEARSAAEEVEYVNGPADSPMGRLRAANGHPEPYRVEWWSIGNEMYGWWQLGNMALDDYVIKHNLFAKAMRRVDPTIKLFAAGAAPDETTVTHISSRVTRTLKTAYDSPADFTGGLLRSCLDNIDFLSEHFYCYAGQSWDLAKNDFVPVEQTLTEFIRRVPDRVRCKAEAYEEYLRRIPGLAERKIPMMIDEWNYGELRPFSLKGALSLAAGLHEMFRYTGYFAGSAYTMGTSCMARTPGESVLQTNGLIFKLYRRQFGTIPLAVGGDSPMPPTKGEPGGDKPVVPSGSPTYPLDVSAALTADGKTLTVAIVNPTREARSLTLELKGLAPSGRGRFHVMTGSDENAFNEPGKRPAVEIVEKTLKTMDKTITLAPLSVSLYALELGPVPAKGK